MLAILFGEQPKEKALSASFVGFRSLLFLHIRIQTAFDAPFEILKRIMLLRRMILCRVLNKSKALLRLRRNYGLFCFHSSASQVGVCLSTKKPWCIRTKAFDL
jgi:hypothetical protein